MPHAGLARNTAASSLALSPDIVLPAALHFLQLTPTFVHTDGLYLDLASQKSRRFSHRLWGNASTVFRSSDQIAVCDSRSSPLHSFDRAEWHSTYIQWLSKKYLHQRKRCAHEPWLDGLGPPYRDLRMTPG